MDKLTFNETNNNEEIENKKKKRLAEGSFDPGYGPIVFKLQSSHLEVRTPREGPIQDSSNCQTQEVSSSDPLVSMKICGAKPFIVG